MNSPDTTLIVPKRIFIVPYRQRKEQKFFFSNQMDFLLKDADDYEIYFSHQCDERQFNRGATKNIGFLVVKEKYPDDYKDMTFIFNDVDTLPFHRIFDYQTTQGIVKHYYGFEYALGGIVVIKGADFERINGFPNFWGWGNEDSVFQERCLRNECKIDRSQFYPIGSPEILQLFDGVKRLVSPREYTLGQQDSGVDGLSTLRRVTYSVDDESLNPLDNLYTVQNERIQVINILSFLSLVNFEKNDYYQYDLRQSTRAIVNPAKEQLTRQRVVTTDDWKISQPQQPQQRRPQQQTQQQQQNFAGLNKYSPEYARYVGAKPRATASANIRLGGVRRR